MKAQSWHGRLALFYGPLEGRRELRDITICAYTAAVLVGVRNVLMIIAALSFVAICAASSLFYVYLYLGGFHVESGSGLAGLASVIPITVGSITVLILIGFFCWGVNRTWTYLGSNKDSFIALATEAYNKKVCFKVTFTDLDQVGRKPRY